MGLRVISFFDGMSGGREALKRLNIPLNSYKAYEIDKYAIQIAKKNHPDIEHMGDVVSAVNIKGAADLMLAGSPCQGFSFAGKQLNFKDPRSKLFFNFVDALNTIGPRYFLLENVNMKEKYRDIISKHMGVEPLRINSSLLSGQMRDRWYWTNIPQSPLQAKNVMLEDILEEGFTDRMKSYCLDANYFKGGNPEQYFKKCRRQLVFNYSSSGRPSGKIEGRFSYSNKALTLCAGGYSSRATTGVFLDDMNWRKLTPIECERLQTFPDNYTEGVSNSQRYKMLGNGWTVDVICHILKNMEI